MVTFYRKSQINHQSSTYAAASEASGNPQASRANSAVHGTEYVSTISAEDHLPYVVVRPKVNRDNHKKVLRMRSHWD